MKDLTDAVLDPASDAAVLETQTSRLEGELPARGVEPLSSSPEQDRHVAWSSAAQSDKKNGAISLGGLGINDNTPTGSEVDRGLPREEVFKEQIQCQTCVTMSEVSEEKLPDKETNHTDLPLNLSSQEPQRPELNGPVSETDSAETSNSELAEADGVDAEDEANSELASMKGVKSVLDCAECGRRFQYVSQLVLHQRLHTGERPYRCPECGKTFHKNYNLTLHMKTHGKSHIYQPCPYCKIKFSYFEYGEHMKTHINDVIPQTLEPSSQEEATPPPVTPKKAEDKICSYCGKAFRFQSALIRHVRVHTGEKPYKCDICGKAFGQPYFLRVHELTHWSVKRYNCTGCQKSFAHYSNAKNHSCGPPGKRNSASSRAAVTRTLTYTCHICKNVFGSLQVFNSHMRNHAGAKLFRCLSCDKLFPVESEYITHRIYCGRGNLGSTIKDEEIISYFRFSVPRKRHSSSQNLGSRAVAKKTDLSQAQPAQIKLQKGALKKSLEPPVTPHVSYFVSKLNGLDNGSDPRKFSCQRCGRLFRNMGRLRAHMLSHAARGQSFSCVHCGKTFENWRRVWLHQRLHRQQRGRFRCSLCGHGFRFAGSYKKHMSGHPGFKWTASRPRKVVLPYECEQCRSCFKTLDLLFSHQPCLSAAPHLDLDLSVEHQSNTTSPPSHNPRPSLSSQQEAPFKPVHETKSALDRSQTLRKRIPPSRGDSSPVGQCAVCGGEYAISELYHHYLKHARGQV
ncbi:zinc finger protein 79 [Synchiropus splendidus]|uniref:zinc finger protein 79 n=1 Tax=Synchiropus splendidus TaxID=270530 RepID=UPI00237EC125|nr:zinc finger protein 79 [Synchiropus splendidus]